MNNGWQKSDVKRPLLRYFGGKWQLRHWIIEHFPEHRFYAEPFAGGASILLAKAPAAGGEIINDLNGDVINLFRVMQNDRLANQLFKRLRWTPFSQAEHARARVSTEEPVERARRMLIRSFMGIEVSGVRGTDTGFRMGNVDLQRLDYNGKRTFRNCARDWDNWRDAVEAIRERLAQVMIYQRDALEFLRLMWSKDCLLYVDPPYHSDTRTRPHRGATYVVEFAPDQHERLVDALLKCPAKIVLSGYRHEVYRPLEKAGWKRVEKEYRANMSLKRRTECLWLSPNISSGKPFTKLNQQNKRQIKASVRGAGKGISIL